MSIPPYNGHFGYGTYNGFGGYGSYGARSSQDYYRNEIILPSSQVIEEELEDAIEREKKTNWEKDSDSSEAHPGIHYDQDKIIQQVSEKFGNMNVASDKPRKELERGVEKIVDRVFKKSILDYKNSYEKNLKSIIKHTLQDLNEGDASFSSSTDPDMMILGRVRDDGSYSESDEKPTSLKRATTLSRSNFLIDHRSGAYGMMPSAKRK